MAADGLKQRLVGGATLLVVAVIAWFWLLSADSPVDPVARESQIPAAPEVQPFAVPEPAQPQNIEPIGSARESAPAIQSDVVPQSRAQVSSVPAPKPVQAAPAQPAKATAPLKTDALKPHSAVGKSNAAAASTMAATAPAQKAEPLKSVPTATKNSTPETLKPKAADSKLVPETFQLDQQGLPVAWVVQIGLFSTQASADKIKATLQEKGFKAYTQAFKSEKASGIKVFVGPKLSRERADAQKKAIDELLKTNTMVVRFVAN